MKNSIILGVTGGIAAYKMIEVASTLTKMGNNVKVIMTENATRFITPMTFRAITHNPVYSDLFDFNIDNDINHITLAEETDLILIAPATANFIARMAHGMANDLLTTTVLASKAPVLLSPAMNVNMFKNKIVQENINKLQRLNVKVIKPAEGYLACGKEGEGRLPEPYILVEYIRKHLTENILANKKVLITAGPTREAVDPVRFLSNYSSGKMGYALAESAAYRGAEVKLISGPTNLDIPLGVERIDVETAVEMNNKVQENIKDSDIIIMVAAVADYRPANRSSNKIKKDKNKTLSLELKKNPDILKNTGKSKKEGQLLIGFAAESENVVDNARSKLERKKLDMIIANDISKKETGFVSNKNQVYIITENGSEELAVMEKKELATRIISEIIKL